MALTEEQNTFINHDPTVSARVLAGPGTGKSFTSVAYLAKILDDNPGLRVGYITFTRAATAEFAKKIAEGELDMVAPKTMHGFSLSVLLSHQTSAIPYPLRMLDTWERKNIAHYDISRALRGRGFAGITPKTVADLESEMAAGFQSLDGARLHYAETNPELLNAYKGTWNIHRRRYGYTILSELPYHAGNVLEDMGDSDLGLDLLIVDEYQDLNHADQKVLKEVSNRGIAIVAIGDDDQSIYSWRNAAPDGIRGFLTTFETENDYPLTVSMRCGGEALQVASDLIEQDSGRARKPRLTTTSDTNNTEFHYLKYANQAGEARGVAQVVAARIASGVAPNDIAILVRSSISTWANHLKPEFAALGVHIGEALDVEKLFSAKAVRKGIALAQLLMNENDSIAWRSLIKVTPGIGDRFIENVIGFNTEKTFSENLQDSYEAGFPDFGSGVRQATELMEQTRTWLGSVDLDNVELGENGWGEFIIHTVGEENFEADALTLIRLVGAQIGSGDPIHKYLAELETSAKELASGAAEGVRLMTMAQSKGLTVNTAIVLGVEQGNIPRARATNIDEERRLLYVALTRGTHLTVITYANRRMGPTAYVGDPRANTQREQSEFIRNLGSLAAEDGDLFQEPTADPESV